MCLSSPEICKPEMFVFSFRLLSSDFFFRPGGHKPLPSSSRVAVSCVQREVLLIWTCTLCLCAFFDFCPNASYYCRSLLLKRARFHRTKKPGASSSFPLSFLLPQINPPSLRILSRALIHHSLCDSHAYRALPFASIRTAIRRFLSRSS